MSYGADDIQVVAGRNEMSRKDWIRYDGHFIYVEKLPGGGYHLDITDKMPDNVLVRDMLVAATFEGTYIEPAKVIIKEGTMKQPTKEQAQARAAARAKRASYPLPVRFFLGLLEFILYIVIGGIFIAVPLAILAGLVWIIGKAVGVW